MADQPKNFSGSVHFPMPHDPEPAPARQLDKAQLSAADTKRLHEILYQLNFNFGDQWPQRLVLFLDQETKARLFDAFVR